jgi:hypothetical protein
MNPGMVATAMLVTAEQPLGPYPTKITGDLSHGYKMTLIVDAAGKRTLEFTPPTEPKEIP